MEGRKRGAPGPGTDEHRRAPEGAGETGPEAALDLRGLLRRAVEGLTFSDEIRSTTAAINRLCAVPSRKLHFFFTGHVSGIKNLVYHKAIDMALLYNAIRRGERRTRLRALARLRDEADNYQGFEMPFNTRRLLIALMKETVKAGGDELRQRRCVQAFQHALSGRAYVVRKTLDEFGLAEVPEGGPPRRGGAWDDQVYDEAGPGRKSPAQLVLDAYIKGLSRLTIVHPAPGDPEAMEEALEAGRLMGIELRLGVELRLRGVAGLPFTHLLLLRGFTGPEELHGLLDAPAFRRLARPLEAAARAEARLAARMAEGINRRIIPLLNEGYPEEARLAELDLEELLRRAGGRPSRIHWGEELAGLVAAGRAVRRAAHPEAERIDELPAAELRRRYLDPLQRELLREADFPKAERFCELLREEEPRRRLLCLTRPLEWGLEAGVAQLLTRAADLDALEIWNNRARDPAYAEETGLLEELRRALNAGDDSGAAALLARKRIEPPFPEALAEAAERYRRRPLEAAVGSHSDGHNHLAPGMGFVRVRDIRNWRAVLRSNRSSPLPLPPERRPARREAIIPLGKDRGVSAAGFSPAEAGAEGLRWRDLSRGIRTTSRMVGGALLALLASLLIALLTGLPTSLDLLTLASFFLITYSRNFIVDETARHGLHPSRWRLASFDATNAANSVFFTFLSIPLLRLVEELASLLLDRAATGELLGRLLRFLALSLANGLYIYGHNSLRGFTAAVKRANFARSALAFPLAVGLSYLNPWPALIGGVLVNKIAADIIGGFTEVAFKIAAETRRARLLYAALLPTLAARPGSKAGRDARRMAVLDCLYVWGNAPRGKDELARAIDGHPEREEIWRVLASPVQRFEDYVAFITTRTSWRKPRRIKLEFLRLAAAFSYWLEKRGPAAGGGGSARGQAGGRRRSRKRENAGE